jgi:hypothetical protein
MSESGHERRFYDVRCIVRYPPNPPLVRFAPNSGHEGKFAPLLLCPQNRRSLTSI